MRGSSSPNNKQNLGKLCRDLTLAAKGTVMYFFFRHWPFGTSILDIKQEAKGNSKIIVDLYNTIWKLCCVPRFPNQKLFVLKKPPSLAENDKQPPNRPDIF